MKAHRILATATLCLLGGCASVDQADLDAWNGAPVSVLDQHPYFARMPARRAMSADGQEVRTYSDGFIYGQCSATGSTTTSGPLVVGTGVARCNSRAVTCDHVFFVRNAVVTKYSTVGACHTDASMRPTAGAQTTSTR